MKRITVRVTACFEVPVFLWSSLTEIRQLIMIGGTGRAISRNMRMLYNILTRFLSLIPSISWEEGRVVRGAFGVLVGSGWSTFQYHSSFSEGKVKKVGNLIAHDKTNQLSLLTCENH